MVGESRQLKPLPCAGSRLLLTWIPWMYSRMTQYASREMAKRDQARVNVSRPVSGHPELSIVSTGGAAPVVEYRVSNFRTLPSGRIVHGDAVGVLQSAIFAALLYFSRMLKWRDAYAAWSARDSSPAWLVDTVGRVGRVLAGCGRRLSIVAPCPGVRMLGWTPLELYTDHSLPYVVFILHNNGSAQVRITYASASVRSAAGDDERCISAILPGSDTAVNWDYIHSPLRYIHRCDQRRPQKMECAVLPRRRAPRGQRRAPGFRRECPGTARI